jgi:protein CpxP
MKKLVGLTAIVILFSLTISAQRQNERQGKRADYSPEQIATLQTKKMALRLDLNENQKKEVQKLTLKYAEERQQLRATLQKNKQDGTGLTSNERFERENMRLERQLAHKNSLKKILTDEQFEKWEATNKSNKRIGNKRMGDRQGFKKGDASRKQYKNRS